MNDDIAKHDITRQHGLTIVIFTYLSYRMQFIRYFLSFAFALSCLHDIKDFYRLLLIKILIWSTDLNISLKECMKLVKRISWKHTGGGEGSKSHYVKIK